MCGGSPSAPLPPAAVPEAPRTPDPVSGETASDRDKRRRATAAGQSGGRSTILTSSRGTENGAATATKNLLGQ